MNLYEAFIDLADAWEEKKMADQAAYHADMLAFEERVDDILRKLKAILPSDELADLRIAVGIVERKQVNHEEESNGTDCF